jgi:hypothetical protein
MIFMKKFRECLLPSVQSLFSLLLPKSFKIKIFIIVIIIIIIIIISIIYSSFAPHGA